MGVPHKEEPNHRFDFLSRGERDKTPVLYNTQFDSKSDLTPVPTWACLR